MVKSKLKKAAVITAVGAAGILGVTFANSKKPLFVPAYRVAQVIDGDTFMTKEIQYIRDNAYDAPELDQCGGLEAKRELEKLILGKEVYLKVYYHDSHNRLMASVYTEKGLLATQMLTSGWVELNDRGNLDQPELKLARDKAQAEKKGIYSEKCTQTTNPDKPSCLIKANVNTADGTKLYFFPGCNQYETTVIQRHHGDQWFCTEAQAKTAGFTKGKSCPEHYVPEK